MFERELSAPRTGTACTPGGSLEDAWGARTCLWPSALLGCVLGLGLVQATPCLASYEEHLSGHLSGQLSRHLSEQLSGPLSGQISAGAHQAGAGLTGEDPALAGKGGLVHKGKQGAEPRLDSAGTDIALAYALPLLAPAGWSVSGAHLAGHTPVSWDAQKGWLATLERLAGETDTLLVVDWDARCLVVADKKQLLAASGTAGQASSTARDVPSGSPASKETSLTQRSARSDAKTGTDAESGARKTSARDTGARPAGGAPAASMGRHAGASPQSLVVSHYGGYGLVSLARPMTAERAARVFDVKLENLLAWNGIAAKTETLPEGRALWLKDPRRLGREAAAQNAALQKASRQNTRARADKEKAAQASASASGTAGTTAPLAKADKSEVDRALEKARSEKRAAAGQRPAANASGSGARALQPAESLVPDGAWTLSPGSLHDQVEAWALRAGWKLVWQADTDLAMEARADFAGSFPEVVRALFEGLHENGAPYQARLFHGNRVLQVEDR